MDIIQLNKVIDEAIKTCDPKRYPKICNLIKDSYARKKVYERIKDLVINFGIENVISAINQIETELEW